MTASIISRRRSDDGGTAVVQRYQGYGRLSFDRPAERVLRVTMQSKSPGNRVDEQMHRELIRLWREGDEDQDVNAIILRLNGSDFAHVGRYELLVELTTRLGGETVN